MSKKKKRGSTNNLSYKVYLCHIKHLFSNLFECLLTKTSGSEHSMSELPDGPLKPLGCFVVVVFPVVVTAMFPGTVYMKGSGVSYQQNSINAAIVLWIVCHLSIFTWKITMSH